MDYAQAALWSLAYIFIIIASARKKTIAIPPIAIASNFSWETIALLQDILNGSFWSFHVVWFVLDLVIVCIYLLMCKPVWFSKRKFGLLYIIESVLLYYLFNHYPKGMLLSSFSIDFLMALDWLFFLNHSIMLTDKYAICIGILKLLGDLFAWLYYRQYHFLVNVLGMIVLICNIVFLVLLFYYKKKKKDRNFEKTADE